MVVGYGWILWSEIEWMPFHQSGLACIRDCSNPLEYLRVPRYMVIYEVCAEIREFYLFALIALLVFAKSSIPFKVGVGLQAVVIAVSEFFDIIQVYRDGWNDQSPFWELLVLAILLATTLALIIEMPIPSFIRQRIQALENFQVALMLRSRSNQEYAQIFDLADETGQAILLQQAAHTRAEYIVSSSAQQLQMNSSMLSIANTLLQHDIKNPSLALRQQAQELIALVINNNKTQTKTLQKHGN